MALPDRDSRNGYYDIDPPTKEESRSTIWLALKALGLLSATIAILGYVFT